MSKTNTAAEPSMEEILASIRRIIADEDPAARTATPAPAPVPPPPPPPAPVAKAPEPPPPDEDVLDLAMAAVEAEQVAVAPPRPALVEPPEVPDVAFDDPEPPPPPPPSRDPLREPVMPRMAPPEPEPEPAPRPRPAAAALDDRLLSPGRDSEVASAFGSLSRAIFSSEPRTIEDLTKELLRPMLREWLDDNLPPLVERLVREEIERVARGRR